MRLPAGEIDILARCIAVIAFLEVKSRATLSEAMVSIHPALRSQIICTAAQYLAGRNDLAVFSKRFDAVLTARGAWPQ